METTTEEPKGIPFYSIKSGETHYAKLEPTIAAYLNSSDMGINASRGQDYGWRLGADWVKRIKAFRRNQTQMSILTSKNGGQKPTTIQILYYMYGEELANFYEEQEENENPFEDDYQDQISGRSDESKAPTVAQPKALADFQEDEDDMADIIDDVIADDEDDEPRPLSPEEQKAADEAELAKMEKAEKDAKTAAEKAKQSQKAS